MLLICTKWKWENDWDYNFTILMQVKQSEKASSAFILAY